MITFQVDFSELHKKIDFKTEMQYFFNYFKERSLYSGYRKEQDFWEYSQEYQDYLNKIESYKDIFIRAYRKKCPMCLSDISENSSILTPAHPLGLNKEFPGLVLEYKNIIPLCSSCVKLYKVKYKKSRGIDINNIIDLNKKIPNIVIPIFESTLTHISCEIKTNNLYDFVVISSRARDTINRFCPDLLESINLNSSLGYIDSFNERAYKSLYKKYFDENELLDNDYDYSIYLQNLNSNINKYLLTSDIKKENSIVDFSPLLFEFDNLRGFPSSKVKLDNSRFLCIIGENGIGKTTLLQSLYFCLNSKLNSKFRHKRNDFKKRSNIPLNISFSYTKDSELFKKSVILDKEFNVVRSNISVKDYFNIKIDIHSIFIDDYRNNNKNINANINWLFEVSNELFSDIAFQIKYLLSIENSTLYRSGNKILAEIDGRKINLDKLSSGYKAIINIILTIRKNIDRYTSNKKNDFYSNNYKAIVFIDEIELHLHPKWKVQIVNKLVSIFPDIYFIITTHDPLVIKQCNVDNCIQIKKDESNNSKFIDVISFESYDIDMILSSPLFGIDNEHESEERLLGETYRQYLSRKIINHSIREYKHLSDNELAIRLEMEVRNEKN
ncbi:AAA family ATPase [Aliivibrio fischeri]|uniref:AAA family ATPase n=1 Tax=Aliivibrio fischeri TaxID=668 RepID=UPI0007C4362A|nr:AAA family ATPase [Aliivibrio fischeri]